MKKTNKKQAAAWVLSLLPLVMIAAVYRRLPAEVPMHWDLDGAVDYGAKAQLWAIAATAPVLEAMFCFLPKIDPKNKNYDKFGDAYLGIQLVTLLFLAAMTGICITEALRPGTVNVSGVVCLLVSLLMVYLGNVMPRFPHELVLRLQNAVGAVERDGLDAHAARRRAAAVRGGPHRRSRFVRAGGHGEVRAAARAARARLRSVDCHELEILPRREQEMTGKAERNNHTQTCVRQVYL